MTADAHTAGRHPFDLLKARYCIALIAVAWYQPGSEYVYWLLGEVPWYWYGVAGHYYSLVLELLFLAAAAYFTRFQAAKLVGRAPRLADARLIVVTSVFVYCIGTVIVYVTVYPLSSLFPEFGAWWLRWIYRPLVFVDDAGNLPLAANALGLLAVAVLGPLVEELLFRGYLLHRWTRKWGLWPALLWSSALFAALHASPVSAFVSGVIFALVYLSTRSLWVAVAVHGLSNLAVWLYELQGAISYGRDYYAVTPADFEGWLWFAGMALLVSLLIVDHVLRRKGPLGPFLLPDLPKMPAVARRSVADALTAFWYRGRGR